MARAAAYGSPERLTTQTKPGVRKNSRTPFGAVVPAQVAVAERRVLPPQAQRRAVEGSSMETGVVVLRLGGEVLPRGPAAGSQASGARGRSRTAGAVAGPRDRHAAAVTAACRAAGTPSGSCRLLGEVLAPRAGRAPRPGRRRRRRAARASAAPRRGRGVCPARGRAARHVAVRAAAVGVRSAVPGDVPDHVVVGQHPGGGRADRAEGVPGTRR